MNPGRELKPIMLYVWADDVDDPAALVDLGLIGVRLIPEELDPHLPAVGWVATSISSN